MAAHSALRALWTVGRTAIRPRRSDSRESSVQTASAAIVAHPTLKAADLLILHSETCPQGNRIAIPATRRRLCTIS
jgi:hypothetical protein